MNYHCLTAQRLVRLCGRVVPPYTAINGKLADFSIIVNENAGGKEINGEQCLYLFKENDNSELMSQGGGFIPVEITSSNSPTGVWLYLELTDLGR
jgi:hypothetical protein